MGDPGFTPIYFSRILTVREMFGVGRSNGSTFKFQKSKMAADGHLGYTKIVITSQSVCRSIDVMNGSVVGFSAELSFYQRVSIASYASAGIARAEMSVRPSVCPSHSGIVSKRRKLAS